MVKILLVTCKRWPGLSVSDQTYADALARRGCTVLSAPWNGQDEPFRDAGAVVLRAAWDYAEDSDGFRSWLDRMETTAVPLFNPAALVRWNLDKRYLLELSAAGVAIPALRVLEGSERIPDVLADAGWERAVLKPVVGQSGHGVALVRRGEMPALDGSAADGRPLILQEFVPEVQAGELAFVFFDGAFSHSFARVPPPREFRVNSQYGGRVQPVVVSASVVAQARAVLDALPEIPLYARVDGVLRESRLLVMELELIEPGLALDVAPASADRFAAATLYRLGL